jgi:hypothetical protein
MRIPNSVQLTAPWRVHELASDFDLEDVWAYPGIAGTAGDFDAYLSMVLKQNPVADGPFPARALWRARDLLGKWFRIGEITPPAGSVLDSLTPRLPDDLKGTVEGLHFDNLPFVPLYRTSTEFAAEAVNATVHAVMHIAWVERSAGDFAPQLAVYVKPNGRFGRVYMAAIKPFRYWVVYPAMERASTARWNTRRAH